jgi:hypothetical protein
LMQLDEEDLTPASSARMRQITDQRDLPIEVMKASRGVDPEKQLAFARGLHRLNRDDLVTMGSVLGGEPPLEFLPASEAGTGVVTSGSGISTKTGTEPAGGGDVAEEAGSGTVSPALTAASPPAGSGDAIFESFADSVLQASVETAHETATIAPERIRPVDDRMRRSVPLPWIRAPTTRPWPRPPESSAFLRCRVL